MAVFSRRNCLTLAIAILSATAVHADDVPCQEPAAFLAALHFTTTSPPYIAIAVINDTTGQRIGGCITANALLGAVMREYGLEYGDALTRAINLSAQGSERTFHFKQQKAWDNMPAYAWRPEACAIIKAGKIARQADIGGEVYQADK